MCKYIIIPSDEVSSINAVQNNGKTTGQLVPFRLIDERLAVDDGVLDDEIFAVLKKKLLTFEQIAKIPLKGIYSLF